jgi:hypothetical protein
MNAGAGNIHMQALVHVENLDNSACALLHPPLMPNSQSANFDILVVQGLIVE